MASPNLIPYTTFFFGRPTKIYASIDTVTALYVSGHVIHNGGIPIPFTVEHEGYDSFLVGTYRFYFKDWTKTPS